MVDGPDLQELKRRTDLHQEYEVVQEETIRAGQTVLRVTAHPLDKLYRRGKLSQDQYDAGSKLRAWYEAGGAKCPAYDGMRYGTSLGTPPENAMEAAGQLAMLKNRLPGTVYGRLERVCGMGHEYPAVYLPEKVLSTGRARLMALGKFQDDLDELVGVLS